MVSVLLFEDNKHLRESLSLYLANTDGIWLSGAFADATQAVKIVRKYKPDVVLMDIQMPYVTGIDALISLRKAGLNTKVLIQTVFEDDDKVFAAICSGANGYIIKNPKPETYVQAIMDVHNGGSPLSPSIAAKVLSMFQTQFAKPDTSYVQLTPREKKVLQCMVEGMSYKMIADACEISFSTVHTHIKHIYEKLHVNSAPEAVVKALKWKLV
jgi:DNA-binding NarL/FixJ family response regulator